MELRLNLGAYLTRQNITAYRLAQAAKGKVARNTVYDLARRPAQRIDLTTVGRVIKVLESITGEPVRLDDLIEGVEQRPQRHLALIGLLDDPVYGRDTSERIDELLDLATVADVDAKAG